MKRIKDSGCNTQGIKKAVESLLKNLGYDKTYLHLKDTPKRVALAWEYLTSGEQVDIHQLFTIFENEVDELYSGMVILKDCDFYSLCAHHLLPFYGKVHIGYIPDEKIAGISKLARVVECYSRRLQIQEKMTDQIADIIIKCLEPKGVMVVIEGIHLCMRMRGIQKQNTVMLTSAVRGVFKDDVMCRNEFLRLIRQPNNI